VLPVQEPVIVHDILKGLDASAPVSKIIAHLRVGKPPIEHSHPPLEVRPKVIGSGKCSSLDLE